MVTRVEVAPVGHRGRFAHRLTVDRIVYSFLHELGAAWVREGDEIEAQFETRGTYRNIKSSTLRIIREAGSQRGNGFVYVLTNKSMKGLVKVGFTEDSPIGRAGQLSAATGVPTPFEVAWCLEVHVDPRSIEKICHQRMRRYRVGKEFFKCSVDHARREVEVSHVLVTGNEASASPDAVARLASARAIDENRRAAFLREQTEKEEDAKRRAAAMVLLEPPRIALSSPFQVTGSRTSAEISYQRLSPRSRDGEDVLAGRKVPTDFPLWTVRLKLKGFIFSNYKVEDFCLLADALEWCRREFSMRGEQIAYFAKHIEAARQAGV